MQIQMLGLLLLMIIGTATGFSIQTLDVVPGSYTINTVTTYRIFLTREYSPEGDPTDWSTTPVPQGSNVTISFPSVYNMSVGYTCDAPYQACYVFGQDLVVPGLFPTDTYLQNLTLVVNNVLNPSPAVVTDEFMGKVGIESTVPSNNPNAVVTLVPANFKNCSINFSPSNVNRANSMQIYVTPTNPIPANGTVVFTFPVAGSWFYDIQGQPFGVTTTMVCVNLTSSVLSSLTCTGGTNSLGAKTVTASGVFTSANSNAFGIQINNILSPPTTYPKDPITITSDVGGYSIDTCITTVTGLQPNTMSMTITPTSTMVINRAVPLRFSMNLTDIINSNDSFLITFPTGSRLSVTNVNAGGIISLANLQTINSTIISFSQVSSTKNFTAGYNLNITLSNFTAPPSTQPTSPIIFAIQRDGYSKMEGSATVQAVMSTLSFTVSAANTVVNTNTSYTFMLTTLDALSTTGRIKIDFPNTVKQVWTSTNCAVVVGTNMLASPDCTVSANSLILSNLNSSSLLISAQTINITILGILNPPTTEPSSNFSITTYYSTTDDTSVATGTMGTITPTVSTLNSSTFTIVPSSYVVQEAGVTYTVSFATNNEIPVGGYIVLGVPNGVQAVVASVSGQCSFAIDAGAFVGTACTGTAGGVGYVINFTSAMVGAAVQAKATVRLRIASIFTNPSSTLPVSTFTVQTYSNTGYIIDRLLVGLSVTMTTPAGFSIVEVNASSKTNSAVGNYSVKLAQPSTLLSSSFLQVIFPSEITPANASKCYDLISNALLTCTVNGSLVNVTLASTAVSTSFGVIVTNVKNGPSFKPSGRFGFKTKTPDTVGQYSQNLATVTITNTIASTFTAVSGTFTPQILDSSISGSITFTPTSEITGYVLLNMAPSFIVSALNCDSFTAFTGTCAAGSSPSMLNITGSFSTSQMIMQVSGFKSPTATPSDSSTLTSYDSSGFIIDQSLTSLKFTLNCSLPCKTCSTSPTSCLTCYTNTVVTPNIYHNNITNQCVESCSAGLYIDTVDMKCAACSSICETCVGVATNCLSCVAGSTYQYFNKTGTNATCLKNCDTGMYPDGNNTCVVCVPPCVACINQTACLSCVTGRFLHQNSCLVSCPENTTVANSSTSVCDACSTNCLTCSGSIATCTSCPTTTVLHNNACLASCPSPYVNKSGICSQCDSPCQTCSIVSTNCTSCISSSTTPHYLNFVCYDVCPSGYYIQSPTGPCLDCSSLSINCRLCKNASSCIACDPTFMFFPLNSSCLSFVPAGYVNISGTAQKCTGLCQTCSILTSNCTSCTSGNLQDNRCIQTCKNTSAPVAGVCTPCAAPCQTCSATINTCTSCVVSATAPVYLTNNRCEMACPDYTYPNSSGYVCSSCVTPCLACTSVEFCKTCVSGFSFYNNYCYEVCPAGFVAVGSQCVACASPCKTCSGSTTTCNSCLSGLSPQRYLIGTNCVISSSCPDGTFPNINNNQCTSCSPACSTCVSLRNCTSCISGFNLQNNSCNTNCTSGTTPVSSVCATCATSCLTCQATISTCTSCITTVPALYLSGYRCVSTCPNTTYANGTTFECTRCAEPCSYCTSNVSCVTCIGGYYLFGSICYLQCPVGYVGIGIDCVKCLTGCLTCENSTFTCKACQAGYYMMNLTNQCVSQCPNGLYQDPISATCIGCTLPCLGCTGTTNNCTICSTGSLFNNTCVSPCPDAHYSFNSICQPCALGCVTCTSATNCSVCNASFYFFSNSCVLDCPNTHAVVVDRVCTKCSVPSCQECTNGDYCTICASPMLVYQGGCYSTCETNYGSNGTHCVALPIEEPKVSTSIFPIPFTIATLVVVIMCMISKFQNGNTFASGAIYALLGLFEWGSLLALLMLYAMQMGINLITGIILGAFGVLYIINFVCFGLMLSVYRKDEKFLAWSQKTCSSRTSYAVALIICFLVTHKYVHLLFSRLFNLFPFKAQLSTVRQFFYLHLMGLLSLISSCLAIGIASYIVYWSSTTSTGSISQLFLCALDVIIVSVLNIIFGGSNAHKNENFFEQHDGDLTINKKINIDDTFEPKDMWEPGVASEKESAFCGKYLYGDQLEFMNSLNKLQGAEHSEEVSEFVVEEDDGDQAAAPHVFVPEDHYAEHGDGSQEASMEDVSIQALEIIDEQHQEMQDEPGLTEVQKLLLQIEEAAKNAKANEPQPPVVAVEPPPPPPPEDLQVVKSSKQSIQVQTVQPSPIPPTILRQTRDTGVQDSHSQYNFSKFKIQPPVRQFTDRSEKESEGEGFEVINLNLRDSQVQAPLVELKPQEPPEDETLKKEKELEQRLRLKEEELRNIKKQVEMKEKEKERREIEQQKSLIREVKVVPISNTFVGDGATQSPIITSKVLQRSQKMEPPRTPTEQQQEQKPPATKQPPTPLKQSKDGKPSKPMRYSQLKQQKQTTSIKKKSVNESSRLEMQEKPQIGTPLTETIVLDESAEHAAEGNNLHIKLENIQIEKSVRKDSDDQLSKEPPGMSSRSPTRLLPEDSYQDNQSMIPQSKEVSRGPIILTAAGSSFTDNRALSKSKMQGRPRRGQESLQAYRTMQLPDRNRTVRSNLAYDASQPGQSGQDNQLGYTGISPSMFNEQNQRFDKHRSPPRPNSNQSSLPLKPQVVSIKTKLYSTDEEAREFHRRVPLMVAVGGGGVTEPPDSLKDYYEVDGRSSSRQDRSLERVYLQRGKIKPGRKSTQDKY